MNIDYPKEWFANSARIEGDSEIGAGIPPTHRPTQTTSPAAIKQLDTRIAFGQFVELWRRNKGWNAEELAKAADVDTEDILEIEHDPHCEPEAYAVHALAQVFGVKPSKLMELAGLAESRTPVLREEAIRFAARSESIESLTHHEREAFEAFATTLSEEHSTHDCKAK